MIKTNPLKRNAVSSENESGPKLAGKGQELRFFTKRKIILLTTKWDWVLIRKPSVLLWVWYVSLKC